MAPIVVSMDYDAAARLALIIEAEAGVARANRERRAREAEEAEGLLLADDSNTSSEDPPIRWVSVAMALSSVCGPSAPVLLKGACLQSHGQRPLPPAP